LLPATSSSIVADRQSVRLDPGAVATDVAIFERFLSERSPEALERAAALYRGDLLEGIGVRDPAFEDWLLIERQRLRQLADEALAKLLTQSMTAGAGDRAAAAARQLLKLDPLREVAFRALMQICADQGQTAQALKLYETLRDRLHRELGVKPEAETLQLYDSILHRRAAAAPPTEPMAPEIKEQPGSSSIEATVSTSTTEPPLPSRPSIAVLPFENLSGDPEQRYFSDGITEDIITELSRNHGLLVIARHSSFQYRNRAIDIRQVGHELGAHYVVDGSIRKTGSQIRIGVQLIDAATGSHLWAERYDRELQAIFTIQDEVTTAIVAALGGQVQAAGIGKVRSKRTDSLAAYDLFLRGLEHLNRSSSEDTVPARDMFARAIEIDPDFARAYAFYAWTLVEVYWAEVWTSRDNAKITLDHALVAGQRAVALDGSDALCHAILVYVYIARKSFDLAAHHLSLATRLNPNDSEIIYRRAQLEMFTGQPQQALHSIEEVMRLNPTSPNYCWALQGHAFYQLRRYEEAARAFERVTAPRRPYVYRYLAACYAQMGRLADAQALASDSLRLQPAFNLSDWAEIEIFESQAGLDHMLEGLRKAGLPE
jgi:adenylate cyclase